MREWWDRLPGWVQIPIIVVGAIIFFGWLNNTFGGDRECSIERTWNPVIQDWDYDCYFIPDPDSSRDPRD